MSHEVIHQTKKNDAKEVIGYDIKVDGVVVGSATKSDKGKFSFVGAGTLGELKDVATMRDLKASVLKIKGLSEYLKANPAPAKEAKKPEEKKADTKKATTAKTEEKTDSKAAAAADKAEAQNAEDEPETGAATADGDVDLD